MILKEIEKEILSNQKKGEFILPFYDKFCLSNVPKTVMDFFGVSGSGPKSFLNYLPEKYRSFRGNKNLKIILLVVDGFGYHQWLNSYQKLPFFKRLTQKGTLLPLTTIFPSTTTAAITTLQTALEPQEHALFEWFLYFKELDQIIMPLPFSSMEKRSQDGLLEKGVSPKILFDKKTIYQKLKGGGTTSYCFMKDTFAKGAYNSRLFRGASVVSYKNSSDLTVLVRKHLKRVRGTSYFYVYWGDVDTIAHTYSLKSEEYDTDLLNLSFQWKTFLEKLAKDTAKNTLLIVLADHGQISVDPKKTIYLNKYKWLINSFEKSKRGRLLLPTGSPRDVFLHIKPRKLEEIKTKLSKALKGRALVLLIEEAIKMGLFGQGSVNKSFLERAGNLLVLPRGNRTVWYEHFKGKRFSHFGHHGGLLKEEMIIPFAIARLSDLI